MQKNRPHLPKKAKTAALQQDNDRPAELTEERIERHYARLILSGEMPGGALIPSNRELAHIWGTSCSTVQRALNNLVVAGLVERTPRRGTFVRPKGQRLFVGLLFGIDLSIESTTHYRQINAALIREFDTDYLSCRTYDQFGSSDPDTLNTSLMHLRMDRRSFAFNGYIWVIAAPKSLPPSELIPPGAPRAIMDPFHPGNDILFDNADFVKKITAELYQRGARKLLCFYHDEGHPIPITLIKEAKRLGIPKPKFFYPQDSEKVLIEVKAYEQTMAYFSKLAKRDMPDAIIAPDDTAARGIIFALLQLRIKIPEQIKIGILSNEGIDIHYFVPTVRYDFPITKVAKQLATLLKQRMAGKQADATPLYIQGNIREEK